MESPDYSWCLTLCLKHYQERIIYLSLDIVYCTLVSKPSFSSWLFPHVSRTTGFRDELVIALKIKEKHIRAQQSQQNISEEFYKGIKVRTCFTNLSATLPAVLVITGLETFSLFFK